MMKIAVILCAFLVINLICDGRSENNEEMDKVSEFCRIQEKASDRDVTDWRNDIKPKPRMAKCLDACVGEKLGMLANNRLNVDAIMRIIVTETTNQKNISDLRNIVDGCKSITDPDRCELSAKILDCINDGARRRGLKEIF